MYSSQLLQAKMYMCIHTYIHAYTHTHTQTEAYSRSKSDATSKAEHTHVPPYIHTHIHTQTEAYARSKSDVASRAEHPDTHALTKENQTKTSIDTAATGENGVDGNSVDGNSVDGNGVDGNGVDATDGRRNGNKVIRVDGDLIDVCCWMSEPIKRAVYQACANLHMCHEEEAHRMEAKLRSLLLFGPDSESFCVDEYALLPDTCARMIVQLPSVYSPDDTCARMIVQLPSVYSPDEAQTTVTNAWEGIDMGGAMCTCPNHQSFLYAVAYPQCSFSMQAPKEGSTAFLVYDVVYPGLARETRNEPPGWIRETRNEPPGVRREPVWGCNYEIERQMQDYVKEWDIECEKLCVVLDERWDVMHERGGVSFANLGNERDRAIVRTLMNCRNLAVGLAGVCVCMYVCMYVCMQ
jgi:hypothetical protein